MRNKILFLNFLTLLLAGTSNAAIGYKCSLQANGGGVFTTHYLDIVPVGDHYEMHLHGAGTYVTNYFEFKGEAKVEEEIIYSVDREPSNNRPFLQFDKHLQRATLNGVLDGAKRSKHSRTIDFKCDRLVY